ncbi:MAG: hypothetical protein FWF25_04695 [Propionibacteriaceae bacterium]|nr:hypothetical protein [Propionibacteriaceae bacterium]
MVPVIILLLFILIVAAAVLGVTWLSTGADNPGLPPRLKEWGRLAAKYMNGDKQLKRRRPRQGTTGLTH